MAIETQEVEKEVPDSQQTAESTESPKPSETQSLPQGDEFKAPHEDVARSPRIKAEPGEEPLEIDNNQQTRSEDADPYDKTPAVKTEPSEAETSHTAKSKAGLGRQYIKQEHSCDGTSNLSLASFPF